MTSGSTGRSSIASHARSRRLSTCLLAAAALGGGCQTAPSLASYHRLETKMNVPAPAPAAALILDKDAVAQLKEDLLPGDIIIGGKNGPLATLLRLAMDEYSYCTHSGIVDIRDGELVVSHAAGVFKMLKNSPRLLGKVEGKVVPISLEAFIVQYDEIRIIRLPDPVTNAKLAVLTRVREAEGTPFDAFFDAQDPTSFHCSEYTFRTLREAGYEHPFKVARRTPNRSLSDMLAKLGITTEYFVNVDSFADVPGTKTVAMLSRYEQPEMGLAIRDAFAVLHEAVTSNPELRVGDLVSCSPEQLLHFSPPAETYLRATIGLTRARPTMDAEEIRRRNELLYDVIARPHVQVMVAEAPEPGIE